MNNDRLYIDDVLVDLGENVEITLVINSNLFRDISKITGNTTYTIRLPRTANNAAVFGVAGDVRSDDTFPTSYHKADYIRGGVPVITGGRAVLLSVSDMYEISISWGAFAPLADVVNKGLTLPQLSGNETIYFGNQNKSTDYTQAMTTGYYYADYDPYIREVSNEWVSIDSAWYNQGQQSLTLENGAVLTAAVGESMSTQPIARAGSQYIVNSFKFGMVMFIDGVTGAADARAWCVLNEANEVIQESDDLSMVSGLSLRAPVKAATIVINSTSGGTISVGYYGRNVVDYSNSFNTYKNMFCRLPVVNVSWILERIKQDTGCEFVFPVAAKNYIDTLAIPLVTAKANALTMGGTFTMNLALMWNLGAVAISAQANTIFSEQSGLVLQLTATRYAKLTIDIQANYEWSYTGSTPQGHGITIYDGGNVDDKTYSYASNYIEVKIVHDDPDAEDTIYIVGDVDSPSGVSVISHEYESENGSTLNRVLAGYGEIEILQNDVMTLTLKNKRGTLNGMAFNGGQIVINEAVDGDVPRGSQFPIIENLPDIKVTDFVQFLCAITGTIPLNRNQLGKVYFSEINDLFLSAKYDWTQKIIPSHDNVEQAKELTYRLNDYARKNWYRWREDEQTFGNYDAFMTINDDTLESEHDIITFPFAASDGNRLPIFTRGGGGVFGGAESDVANEPVTLKPCEPRIMSVYEAANNTAALRFDIDMQNVIDTQMTGMAASLADVRVIKERVRMSDVELAAFNESVPVYLRQYGSYFAVLTLESSGDGTAIATMLRLRKSLAQPVPPEPPYDYEVDYLESDGLAFIDTGIKASSNVEIQMYLADFFDEQNKNKGAFGGRNGSGSSEYGMMLDNSGNVIIGNGSQITLSPYANYSPRCHVEIGGGVWKIGAATGTYTPSTYESNYNVYLFAMNNSGGAVKGKCKIGAVHITNGVDELDLIPVVKNGEGFMYDRLSGQLYGNIGTGAFTWGNLPYDADVEYIKSSGTQWIDTGLKLTNDCDVDIVYKGHSYSTNIFGGRVSVNSKNIMASIGGAANNITLDFNNSSYSSYRLLVLGFTADKVRVRMNKSLRAVYNLDNNSVVGQNTTQCNDVFTCDTNAYLLAASGNPYYTTKLSCDLCYCKIAEGGAWVRYLIPVRKNGVGYMYDRVTDTLFGNVGTGDFVIGNDV